MSSRSLSPHYYELNAMPWINSLASRFFFFAVDPACMSASELSRRLLAAHGVRVGPVDEQTLRAVTHLDVAAAGIDSAIQAVREVLAA